jgi:hypothetical protein
VGLHASRACVCRAWPVLCPMCHTGGVCSITYEESMEIAEMYFQMPLLRKVGEFFGKFSVIDMSHNMSMYERHMGTYNVFTSDSFFTSFCNLSILTCLADYG